MAGRSKAVGHRARRFGVSHYGIRNRAFVAFEDLLAVRWMQDRWLRYDAVTGWRQQRDDPWLKRMSSRIGNGIRNAITGDHVHDSACTLRVIRSGCLPRLPRFRGFHRFVPTLLRLAGCRVLELPVGHRARRFGVSHYGIRNRAFVAFEDLLAVRWMQDRWLRYDATEEP